MRAEPPVIAALRADNARIAAMVAKVAGEGFPVTEAAMHELAGDLESVQKGERPRLAAPEAAPAAAGTGVIGIRVLPKQ